MLLENLQGPMDLLSFITTTCCRRCAFVYLLAPADYPSTIAYKRTTTELSTNHGLLRPFNLADWRRLADTLRRKLRSSTKSLGPLLDPTKARVGACPGFVSPQKWRCFISPEKTTRAAKQPAEALSSHRRQKRLKYH